MIRAQFLLFALAALVGCGESVVECAEEPTEIPIWAETVYPLLREKCGLCHAKSSRMTPYVGDGIFADEDPDVAWRHARKVAEPCDPDASPLYTFLLAGNPQRMPYPPVDGPLSQDETDTIRDWIAGGANKDLEP